MGDLSPFDFFRQETSHADAVIRTDAMKKVAMVAALLGPEKARTDMLAYLLTKIDDMDQILVAMAEKLGKFVPLIGGPEHSHALIPLFEALCEAEEITVREMVVSSINIVLKQLGPSDQTTIVAYFDFFKRVSNEESGESFYARVSSCHLLPDVYKIAFDVDKPSILEIYGRLCKDELPIVRRAASLEFIHVAELVDSEVLSGECLNILNALLTDESQTIQVVAIEFLSPFSVLLRKHNNVTALTNEILPQVKSYSDSPSWKVRQALSKKYGAYATSFLPAEVSTDVFTGLIHLILDPEPEVRSLAILEVLPFLDVVGTSQFVGELAPAAAQLAEDPVPNVRKLLADLCVDVAAKVGPEAVSQHLSDLILKLISDEDPMVRLRIIKKLAVIAEEAPSLCTRLTEFLVAMFTNTNWRVRQELLRAMPPIVKHMGQDYFTDHFHAPVLALLKDGVDEVRTAAAASVHRIAAVSDLTWVQEALFPEVKSMSTGEYLIRLSMITALEGLLSLEQLPEKFLGDAVALLLGAAADEVPNIRVRAAQACLKTVDLPHLVAFRAQIQAVLEKMRTDADRDVKYFAGLA